MQHHSIVPDACSLGRFFCVLTISLHSIRLWFIVNLTDRKNGNDNNWRARTCNCHPHIWWRRSKIAAKPSRAPTKCNETIERDAKSFYKKKFFRLSTNRISFHLFCCPQFWWDNLIRISRKKKLMRCAYFGVYVFNRKKFDFYFSSKWYKATYQLNIGRFVNENSEDSKNRKREERNDKHGFCKNARVFQHFPATHRHSHRSVGFSFHRIAACFHLLLFFIIAFVFFFSSRFCFLGVCCSFLWLHMRKM